MVVVSATFQEILDTLPTLKCKRKCQLSCGPVHPSPLEMSIIRDFLKGKELKRFKNFADKDVQLHLEMRHKDFYDGCVKCPYLGKQGLCEIYDVRPLICRVWGMWKKMRCQWGCRPSRWLSDDEVRIMFETLKGISV